MKEIFTTVGEVKYFYHKFTNEASDIVHLTDIINFSGQVVTPRPEDNKVRIPLRWNSSEAKILVPYNGGDIFIPVGSYLVVNTDTKKLEIYSITGFGVIFKHD